MGRLGGGCLGKLVILVVLAMVVIAGYLFLTSPSSPFYTGNRSTVNAPAPIVVGTITREFKLITAQVTGSTTIEAETKNALPFSSETWSYQMVMTVTAGIDLTKLRDTDVKTDIENLAVTITLPEPQVLTKERNGWVVARNSQLFSGPSSDKNVVDKMQAAGEEKIIASILSDGKLFREARLNAEIQLRNFILQLGYKSVRFEYANTITPTPPPSSPPR
jgi:hypothetical protein